MFHNPIKWIFFFLLFFSSFCYALPPNTPYRIIAIRHGEKNTKGPNIPLTTGVPHPSYGQGLDVAGYQRAAYFVGYILGIPTILPSAFPDALSGAPTPHPITLFAALYTGSGGTGTWRPVQTITPLANAVFPSDAITNPYNYLPTSSLVLQIDPGPDPDNPDYSALVTAIIDGTHDDDTVVLCWESNALPVMLVDVDEGITGHAPTTTYSLTEDPTFQATFKGTYPKYTYPGKPEEELFNYVFVIIYHDDGGTLRPEFSVLQNPPRSTSGFNNVGGASISQYGFP